MKSGVSSLTAVLEPDSRSHEELLFAVVTVCFRINSRMAKACCRRGLGRLEGFLLLYLSQAPVEACTNRHLRQLLQVSNGTLGRAVKRLCGMGYLTREVTETGPIAVRFTMTAKGRDCASVLQRDVAHVLPAHAITLPDRVQWAATMTGLRILTEKPTADARAPE